MDWPSIYSANDASLEHDPFNIHLDQDLDLNVFAPFQPTPIATIQQLLDLLHQFTSNSSLKYGNSMLDLGSGDGRLCVALAQQKWAQWNCVGIELSERLINISKECAKLGNVEEFTQFYCDDVMTCPATKKTYSVVTVYLLPDALLLNRLKEMIKSHYDAGSLICSVLFPLGPEFRRIYSEDTISLYKL